MSFIKTATTRKNNNSKFFSSPNEWKTYRKTRYEDTGLLLSIDINITNSNGIVEMVHTATFINKSAYDLFEADANRISLVETPRAIYLTENSHTQTITTSGA